MDSRLFHRGTACLQSRRRLLVVSVSVQRGLSAGLPPCLEGSTLSILPCYRNRLRLRCLGDLEPWAATVARINGDDKGEKSVEEEISRSTKRRKGNSR